MMPSWLLRQKPGTNLPMGKARMDLNGYYLTKLIHRKGYSVVESSTRTVPTKPVTVGPTKLSEAHVSGPLGNSFHTYISLVSHSCECGGRVAAVTQRRPGPGWGAPSQEGQPICQSTLQEDGPWAPSGPEAQGKSDQKAELQTWWHRPKGTNHRAVGQMQGVCLNEAVAGKGGARPRPPCAGPYLQDSVTALVERGVGTTRDQGSSLEGKEHSPGIADETICVSPPSSWGPWVQAADSPKLQL